MNQKTIGRFAPTPSGPLHLGSLVAALGSYLQAKSQHGQWLLRIEDLDPPREVPGAADAILRTLEAHGLYWDGEVCYQSHQQQVYQAALDTLAAQGLIYPCRCSRKILQQQAQKGPYGLIYPGTCRTASFPLQQPHALRIHTPMKPIRFTDLRIGPYQQSLQSELGDFVVKRADGLFAYQLAVVVDDFQQGVTEVVRGEDLLDNTPRQIYLQQQLGFPTPAYLHLPLATNPAGQKLSKATGATALDNHAAIPNLRQALRLLHHSPPAQLNDASLETLLSWAISHWRVHRLPRG